MAPGLKRVPHHRFLYTRGAAFYFRRNVPLDARAAFGQGQVWRALEASTLPKARLELAVLLEDFDRRVDAVRRKASGVPAVFYTPNQGELEAGVRAWLNARLNDANSTIHSVRDPDERKLDLEAQERAVQQAARQGETNLSTSWVAEALCERYGWRIEAGSDLHSRLLRTMAQGQMEFSHQFAGELDVIRRPHRDHTFSPAEYAADVELNRLGGPPVSLLALFDAYGAEAGLKGATIKAWRRQIIHLKTFLGHDDATRVTPEDMVGWKEALLIQKGPSGRPLSTVTVQDTYLAAARAVFRWAVANHKLPANPAETVSVRKRKKTQLRSKSLTDAEAETILAATLIPYPSITQEHAFARRWVPWLCAYTGARVNELSQLRAEDVQMTDGQWCIRITPEAGTVKNDEARIVPLHPHVIEQGFIADLAGKSGPLFYSPGDRRGGSAGNPRYSSANLTTSAVSRPPSSELRIFQSIVGIVRFRRTRIAAAIIVRAVITG